MRNYFDESDVRRVIERLGAEIAAAFSKSETIAIIGIRTRGEILGNRLAAILRQGGFKRVEQGVLDITLYRDDLSEIGPKPMVRPTQITVSIDGAPVVLVDDVIFTGRSVRAALDALSDFGRPSVIRLAVLVDRGGRELPIAPDFAGIVLKDVPPNHRVTVRLSEKDSKDEVLVEPRDRTRDA